MRRGPEIDIPEPDLPERAELRDRVTRVLASLMVVVALAAAVVGYLLARATREGELAASRAQELGLEAEGELVRSQQWAHAMYQGFVTADLERLRASLATRASFFAGGDQSLELEAERWHQAAEHTNAATLEMLKRLPGLEASDVAPTADPAFPVRLYAESSRRGLILQAQRDATNDLSSRWSAKAANYTAILAVMAVTLYLVGFAITVRGRVRVVFLASAGTLFLAGSVWTTIAALTPPEKPSGGSGKYFAEGLILLQRAAAGEEDAYPVAEYRLSEAISAYPGLAEAWLERASATYFGASPEVGSLASVTSTEALRRATADLRQARVLGLNSVGLLNNLSANVFHLGLQLNRWDLLKESVEIGRQAVDIAPTFPLVRFNLAAYLLAVGHVDEALSEYRKSATLAREDEFQVAAALSVLDEVVRYRPALSDRSEAIRELIVSTAFPSASTSAGGTPTVEGTTAFARADGLVVAGMRFANFDPSRDVFSIQWYFEDPAQAGEFVIPEISGPVVPTLADDGTYFQQTRYLTETFPARCPRAGRYRAEIYLNGILADEVTIGDVDIGVERAEVVRDLNVAMCVPSAWQRSDESRSDFFVGYERPDGEEGVYVFGLPLSSAIRPNGYSATAEQALSAVMDSLRNGALIGRPVTFLRFGSEPHYFMGLQSALTRWYDYPRGRVLAGSGVDPASGTIYVGFVFGPPSTFEAVESPAISDQVYDSLTILSALGELTHR
jgi:hypothetical protein